ncbi:MAG TPA: CHAP domain-containing protein [Myxococcaceae bacterium]|nr:CHAP domain-containing protein [Myxococcaceae bacterium]
MRWGWLWLLGLSACATGRPLGAALDASARRYVPTTPPAAARPVPATHLPGSHTRAPLPGQRDTVVARAQHLVGKQRLEVDGKRYVAACNGLVEAAYHGMGMDLHRVARPGDNAVTALWRASKQHGRIFKDAPLPGDLVFFRDTYDVNRDARANDGLTHVGLVESVDADGTVTVIHHVSRGVVRYQMTPSRPDERKDPVTGKVLNHALRGTGHGRASATTGQLFVAFGSLLSDHPPLADASAVKR